jgi:hypothetical protein
MIVIAVIIAGPAENSEFNKSVDLQPFLAPPTAPPMEPTEAEAYAAEAVLYREDA